MPFPEVKRVIYKKNPLKEVICQLRFAPILKINTELPADFQDKIRNEFPNYEQDGQALIGPLAELVGEKYTNVEKNHKFTSLDGNWSINLTHTFIALSCIEYERWEEFGGKLEKIVEAFSDIYKPSDFTRIGLRYIDVINRKELGLDNVGWTDLVKKQILGLIGIPKIGVAVKDFVSSYILQLDDKTSEVRIITRFGIEENNNEQCLIIDSDFSNKERHSMKDYIEKLHFLNKRASRLIRWAITEKLHKAMKPEEL
jgi:uncharacterized protein (TIGR04255 family)